MKNICCFALATGFLTLAGPAQASVDADFAANYLDGWTSGANGGGGFGAWSITASPGAGVATNGIWPSATADLSMGDAFGFLAAGAGASIYLDRLFAQAMNTNDVFTLDLGLNYDAGTGGNKGFVLRSADNRDVVIVNQADSEIITINGRAALTNSGTTTMHWTFTQKSATQIIVYATGRSGSEAYAIVLTNAQASYLAGIRFYATSITNDASVDLRPVYFDNLLLSQASGTNAYSYLVESNRTIITAIATNASGAVVIPASLGGYPVTEIGRSAFKDRTNITSLTFASGAGVTNIGATAFQGCTGLMLAVLPNGLTAVPAGLFYGCTGLVSVTIPAGVTKIADTAFAGCRSLTSLALPAGLKLVGESAFLNCRTLNSLDFPAGIKDVPGQCGYECRALAAVELPSSVTNVGYSAFYNCLGLSSLTLPASVTSIAHDAFHGCSGLRWLAFNGALDSVGDQAIYGCTNLITAYFYGSLGRLGAGAFGGCRSLAAVCFAGHAPALGEDSGAEVFTGDDAVTVYALASASGWGATFCGTIVEAWKPVITTPVADSSGFNFSVAWASGQTIRVQACTNLSAPAWLNVSTNTITGGTCSFSDPAWTLNNQRFYRIEAAE